MEWITMKSYFLVSLQIYFLKQAPFNNNDKCLSIITKHYMEKKNMLCYLMLMIVPIGIHLKLLETFLWTVWERDPMWTSWDMHIRLCLSVFHRWVTIPFLYIRIDILLMLWLIIWILPQSRKVQIFIRPLFHMI